MTDLVEVTTVVAVDPADAFAVFTEHVDAWWGRGPRYRPGSPARPGAKSTMRFEPGSGGRLLEVYDDGDETFTLGVVEAWEPPLRLVFLLGGRDFPAGEGMRVEVRFEGVEHGTRVTVHQDVGSVPAKHPVRHGLPGRAFDDVVGVFWADLLVVLQRVAAARRSP